MILPLGSGGMARKGCGSKAASLDRAARAGLPVPPGFVVQDEAWHWALERGLIRVEAPTGRRPVSVPDPSLLVHLVGLPDLAGPLAVRAAFSGEDGADSSVPRLFVDGRRPAALAAGLAGVWAAALGRPKGFRRDVILQKMVKGRCAGTAVTERDYEDDLFCATNGAADEVVAGKIRGAQRPLPKRRGRERPTERDPVTARLQVLLRDVRRAFGHGDWEVEWADDGERIWIIQIRPLVQPMCRDDVFTAAPHRPLAPEPSSRLMTSLMATCEPGLLATFRRLDPALPAGRPLVQVFLGRPFLNLSLLTDVARQWGLPSRLVTDSIGGSVEREFAAQPRRLLAHAFVLAKLGRAQLSSVHSARQAEERILERTASPPSPLVDVAEEMLWLHRTLASETLSLTAAACGPLALLHRSGVLDEVVARWRAEGTAIPDDVPPLRALDASAGAGPPSVRARLLRPVVWQAERTLQALAKLRAAASTGFERLQGALLSHARALVAEDLLPSVEAILQLDLEELGRIGADLRPDTAFWRVRRSENDRAEVEDSPQIPGRLGDLQSLR